MAFEDAYAEVLSTSAVKGFYDEVNDSYLDPLLSLLPNGPAWRFEDNSEMVALLTALSYVLLRAEYRGKDLIEEIDPRTTFELISDWERVLDLPGDNPTPPTTLADRRAAIHAHLLGFNDPTPANYIEIADALGYDVFIEQFKYNPFVAGSPVGDPLTQWSWAYVWYVLTLFGSIDDTLKYFIKRTAPEHTYVFFKLFPEIFSVKISQFGSTVINDLVYSTDLLDIVIAVGYSGKLSSSANGGSTWTARTSQFGSDIIKKGAFADELFVIVGGNGKLSTSSDGENWTARTSQFGATQIIDVLFKNGLWVIIGSAGKISTSSDGITWTARTCAGGYVGTFRTITYGNGYYVIGGTAGEIQRSLDGITWTAQTSQFGSDTIQHIVYNGSYFIAVGDNGKLSVSVDGAIWVAKTSQFGSDNISKLAFNDDLIVAVGNAGKISYSSDDGDTWIAATTTLSATDHLYDIVYSDGIWVAGGAAGSIVVSLDSLTWTEISNSFGAESILCLEWLDYPNYNVIAAGSGGELEIASWESET